MNVPTPEEIRARMVQKAREWHERQDGHSSAVLVGYLLEEIDAQKQFILRTEQERDNQTEKALSFLLRIGLLKEALTEAQTEVNECWNALTFDVETMPNSSMKTAIKVVREGLNSLHTKMTGMIKL